MSLAVRVGMLAELVDKHPEAAEELRGLVVLLNTVLQRHDLPAHVEPESFVKPLAELQRAGLKWPYSFLHFLRRAYAYACEDLAIPTDEAMLPEHEAVIDRVSSALSSHLLIHSDAEGLYVPIDFDRPIFDRMLPGEIIGSSQGLLRELLELAPLLGLELDGRYLSPGSRASLDAEEEGATLWRERLVWYALYEAALISIEHRTLLVFTER